MPLRLRFLLSLLAVLTLMAGPALYAVSRVDMLRDIVLDLRGQAAQSALAVGRLEAALGDVDRYQRVYVATTDPDMAALMRQASAEVAAALSTLRAAGYADLVAEAGLDLDELGVATTRIEALVERGQLEAATSYLITDVTPHVEAAHAAVPRLAAAIDMNVSARVPVAQHSAVTASTATTAAVLVGVALAVALALAAARVLTGPLDRLRGSMARVAEGSFEAPADLPYDRDDEVGDLSRSFRTMTRRLAELDRLKAEFVGTVSHDLKSPVSVITGYAELIQDELAGSLTPRQDELLRSLADQTRSLQRRVDQLLEISRMESGRLRLDLEEIDLRHFAEEVEREFGPAARMRGVQLQVAVRPGTPPVIVADPDVLRTDVVGNLLGNAIRFTPSGGTVRLTISPVGGRVGIEISDNGRGIARDRLRTAFGKYYRSRGTSDGSGLGLAIARAGIENHGGQLDVQSQLGRGTDVRVTLPVSDGTSPAAKWDAPTDGVRASA